MSPCFADTFFFLALLNSGELKHQEKARAANRIDRPVITSDFILLELGDHLCDAHNRHLFAEVLQAVKADRRYKIIPVDPQTLQQAIELYDDRPDKDWSLTDCTSFVIMNNLGITEALTADHHFEQAGFTALLKD